MVSLRTRAQLGLLAAVVVLTAAVGALVLRPRQSRPVAVADVGTVAPDFALYNQSGEPFTLSSFHGQAVVLFFAGSHAPAARQYEQRVNRLAQTYAADERVKFFAIEVADPSKTHSLLPIDHRERAFPTLLDESAAVATRFSVRELPMIVVIDPHGVVRYRGPFDNSPDIAFANHTFAADALTDVLESTTVTVAGK